MARRSKKLKILFIILIILVTGWSIILHFYTEEISYKPNTQNILQQKAYTTTDKYKTSNPNYSQWIHLKPHMIPTGKWIAHKNVSRDQRKNIADRNNKIRLKNDVNNEPFWRKDGKCGIHYLKNRTQTQCNPLGVSPCCNEENKKCSNRTEDCTCVPYCTDYRNIVIPEFADWVETYCPMKDYNRDTTCDLISTHFTSITFIGNSLVRQFFSAFLIHLTNDRKNGAIIHNLRKFMREQCKYENQFVDKKCRQRLAKKWVNIETNPAYCTYTKNKVMVSYNKIFYAKELNQSIEIIRKHMGENQPLFIISIGIHDDFNYKVVWNEFLLPIIKFINAHDQTTLQKPLLIFLGATASGPTKLGNIREQGNEKAIIFNAKMKEYLDNDVMFFDNFLLTYGVYTHDGVHFGSVLNDVRVKLLIKLITYIVKLT